MPGLERASSSTTEDEATARGSSGWWWDPSPLSEYEVEGTMPGAASTGEGFKELCVLGRVWPQGVPRCRNCEDP